jgi:uncharacterized protein (TIGR02217 family)
MSDAVFPSLPGLKWNIKRAPIWKTNSAESVSGKEMSVSLMTYPLRRYSLAYEVLRAGAEAELQTLEGFFNLRRGRHDTWLYNDPDDYTVTDQSFGTGNGTTTAFALARTRGGFTEPVQSLNSAPVIMSAGVTKTLTTDYTISTLGVVTFVTPPADGAALTWSGTYYWRCRFLQDMAEFDQFLQDLWQLQRLEFRTVKL